jgi:hypothetical protein
MSPHWRRCLVSTAGSWTIVRLLSNRCTALVSNIFNAGEVVSGTCSRAELQQCRTDRLAIARFESGTFSLCFNWKNELQHCFEKGIFLAAVFLLAAPVFTTPLGLAALRAAAASAESAEPRSSISNLFRSFLTPSRPAPGRDCSTLLRTSGHGIFAGCAPFCYPLLVAERSLLVPRTSWGSRCRH